MSFMKRIDGHSYHVLCYRGAGSLVRWQWYSAASFTIRIQYKLFSIVTGNALTRGGGWCRWLCQVQAELEEP